jgi:ubiquinone/menaquinone biosynthesis C-methylase UbiE
MSQPDVAQVERIKEQIRRDWSRRAAAWRKWNPQFMAMSRAATEAIIQAAHLTAGMQVLDLASGTGEPALALAEAVGSHGHVTATDLVPEMLMITEEVARQRGLTNLTCTPADAEALPFPAQRFDVVTCRFAIMTFPNVGQALRDIRRVLKPGGRATFVAWGPMEQNPFFTTTVGVFMQHVQPLPPPPGTPSPFAFAKSGTLSAALREAGFTQVQEETRTIAWRFPGPASQCWEFIREAITPPAFRRFFDALAPDQYTQVISEVLQAIGRYDDGQQVNFSAVIVIGTGVG